MQILSAWKDSLSVFIPQNFIQFTRHFITMFTRTWSTWAMYWFWLIAIYLFAALYHVFSIIDNLSTPFTVRGFARLYDSFAANNIFSSILLVLLYVTVYLSAKSLPARKSYAYFFFHIKETIILGLWFLILSAVWHGYRFIEMLILRQATTPDSVGDIRVIVPLLVINTFLLYPLFCFSSFYIISVLNLMGNSFLATQKKALTDAFKLTVYTLPCTALIAIIGVGIYIALYLGGLFVINLVARNLLNLHPGYDWGWTNNWHIIFDLLVALPAIATLFTMMYERYSQRYFAKKQV